MNGRSVGRWWVDRGAHCFTYDQEWLRDPIARPISLSLPLAPSLTYRGDVVENFFDNLLPDSKEMRRKVQSQFGLQAADPLSLLKEIGRDCIGALQILPEGMEIPNPAMVDGEPLTDQDIAHLLRGVRSRSFGAPSGSGEPFRVSVAGMQEKTALLYWRDQWMRPIGATPTTHIIKLPIGSHLNGLDLANSVENEWLCHLVVSAFGLPIAHSEMRVFEDESCLVVERFDRKLHPDNGIVRIPQEDLCQATGTPSARKYESQGGPGIRDCLKLLLGANDTLGDRHRFLSAQFVFWLLCAIDGHAKNFSLILRPQGAYSLAPLYDVMSAYPLIGKGKGKIAPQQAEMAMAIWGKTKHDKWQGMARRHWQRTLLDCAISKPDEFIDQILVKVSEVCQAVESKLPKDFPDYVSGPILSGLEQAAKKLG